MDVSAAHMYLVGCVDTDDSLLKQHVIVQAIEIVCKPLQHQLSQTTSEEEIRTIKAQMKELRYTFIATLNSLPLELCT